MPQRERWMVLGIILIAAFLRLTGLQAPSLWFDEIGHLSVAQQPTLSAIVAGTRAHAAAMPLDYIGQHYFLLLVGTSDGATRLWPALWGILSVPLVYVLGRALLPGRGALLAAFAWATSPWPIFY